MSFVLKSYVQNTATSFGYILNTFVIKYLSKIIQYNSLVLSALLCKCILHGDCKNTAFYKSTAERQLVEILNAKYYMTRYSMMKFVYIDYKYNAQQYIKNSVISVTLCHKSNVCLPVLSLSCISNTFLYPLYSSSIHRWS